MYRPIGLICNGVMIGLLHYIIVKICGNVKYKKYHTVKYVVHSKCAVK